MAARKAQKLVDRSVDLQRELGLRGGLRDFVKMAWPIAEPGKPFQDNWHIGAVSEHLEAVTNLQIKRLVINIPPGCMKSRLTGLFWPVWAWVRDGGYSRWGSWSFDLDLVLREAGDSLDLIRSEWFRARWGDRVIIKDRAPAMGEYWTTGNGLRFASTTPKGDATGWHYDYWLIDDPHKPQTISKVTLEESRKWWYGTLQTRKRDPATTRAVLVMQRLHEKDLAGYSEKDGYVVLRIPMRYEPKAVSITPLGFKDPRTEAGQLLWPARFPESEVRDLERQLGPSGTASQLQQRPAPEGGATFQKVWFRTWVRPGQNDDQHIESEVAYGGSGQWMALPETFDEVIQSWDCAFKDTDGSDYVCGQVWARKGGDFFLLDEVHARMDFPSTCQAIRNMCDRWPASRGKVLIEDKANGPAVIKVLKEEIPGIEEVNPEGGKTARANAVTGDFHAGHVYHPDPLFNPWVIDHRNELTSFPFGENDDRVDACSQAIIYLVRQFRAFAEAMRKFAGAIVPDQCEQSAASPEDVKDAEEGLLMLFGMSRVL